MQRQRDLAADDEGELLRLQEQFAASAAQGDARPAAKVTRITRRPAAPDAAAGGTGGAAPPPPASQPQPALHAARGCALHGPGCQGHHGHEVQQQQQQQHAAGGPQQAAGLLAAMQAALKGIVGEVQERPVAAAAPPQPPTAADAAAAAPFPEATHRKLSKFALGRQRQRAAEEPAPGPAMAPTVLPAEAAGGRSLDEQARIDAENRQLLAAMTPEQVAEAREEAVQRLPPAAVEFLRRRGAEKAKAAAAAVPSAGAAPSAAGQQAASPPLAAPGSGGDTGAASASNARPAQRPRQQPRPQRQPGSANQPGASSASIAGRLRFGIDGSVEGLRPADATVDAAPADVAERDPIRQGEGLGAEGYSVQEACLLARSTLAQQRVLALRLLAAVLALSRPSVACSSSVRVPLPPAIAAELQQQAAAGLEWVAVWHHALHAADVVLLLRRSLDDAHPAVAAAAAQALAALLGAAGPAGAAEEAAAEGTDAAPLAGWPAPPLRHMQRPTASGAWVAAPVGAAQCQLSEAAEDEEALDEQQLAKVDPLSGLLHMQLLERVAYLLGAAGAAAAADPLLSILIRCCQAGKDVADQVVATPGMLDAIKAVLDAPPPPAAAGGGVVAAEGGAAGGATAAAFHAGRPKALRLLRQLAQASKAAARLLQEAGLVRFALEHLLRPAAAAGAGGPGQAPASSGTRRRGQLTEALRLWRCFAQHGFYLLLLDDAYPSLCTSFTPQLAPAAAAQPAALSCDELQHWCVAREAYSTAAQLCWHAARCGPHDSQLSPQCAAALAGGALSWLGQLPLQQLLEAYSTSAITGSQSLAAGEVGARSGRSPYPALAAAGGSSQQAAVLLGTLAAALHFVGSYWSVQVWHTAAEKAAAAGRLAKLGLLPAHSSGTSAGAANGDSEQGLSVLEAVRSILQQLVSSDAAWAVPSALPQPMATPGMVPAAAELAVALARLAATFLPPPQAADASASLLAPLYGQRGSARFLAAAQAADAAVSQPWDVARQLQVLPLARAAALGLQAAGRASTSDGGVAPQAQHWPAIAAADTAQALLRLLPAGEELLALQLMALLLGPQHLAVTAAAAAACLQAEAASNTGLLAADGLAADGGQQGASPPALPDARQLSSLLLAGYAGAWLGMVPESQQEGSQEGRQVAAAAPAVEPPSPTALLRPQGSRLPLPADWMLEEAPVPPPEAGIAAEPAVAAGFALLLALGWEQQQLSSLAARPWPAGAAESRLRLAVLLVFGDWAQAAAGGGFVPGAAVGQGEELAWEQPLARWCLAALMQRYCPAADAAVSSSTPSGAAAGGAAVGGAGERGWQQQEARQLAQHFAAASYGDRLFGAAVATLLRRTVPLDVALEVLSTLADEQALHLLPPLRLLPGPPAVYLDAPPVGHAPGGGGGGGGYGRACFGAGVPGTDGSGGGGGDSDGNGSGRSRQELDLYVKLLSEGPLERCLAAASSGREGRRGGSDGDGGSLTACSVAVPLVLHRLACACFPGAARPGTAETAAGQARRQALLCTIVQRCGEGCGSGGGGDGAASGRRPLLQLLGMLLRWDAAAGQPSGAASRERVTAVEAACASAGTDASAVLQAALEA